MSGPSQVYVSVPRGSVLVSDTAQSMEDGNSQTSSKPKNIPAHAERMKTALTRLGKAYGQRRIHHTPSFPPRKEPGPKIPGKLVTGSARKPPRLGPIITPTLKHIGNSRNARDWYLLPLADCTHTAIEKDSLLFDNNLRDHRPHNPNITIHQSSQNPKYNCCRKRP